MAEPAMQTTALPYRTSHRERPSFRIRPGLVTDEGYIANSWIGSFMGSSKYAKRLQGRLVHGFCRPLVSELIKRAAITVAAPEDDDQTIYGYMVSGPGIIHMVYVRKEWRRYGIATALVAGVDLARTAYSTQTQDLHEWILKSIALGEYKPFWQAGSPSKDTSLHEFALRLQRAFPDSEVPPPNEERSNYG